MQRIKPIRHVEYQIEGNEEYMCNNIFYFISETSCNIYKHNTFYNTQVYVYGSHTIKYESLGINLWIKHGKTYSLYIHLEIS